MAWTYILECSDGTYYVGSTIDLERRVAQHQAGEGARYTRTRLPVALVYCEDHAEIRSAFEREKQLQGWGRAKRQALIDGAPEALRTLARKPSAGKPSSE